MPQPGADLLGRPRLDDPATLHDRDPVAEVADHGDVVADEDEAQPEPLLQLEQQVEHLGADADSRAEMGSSATMSAIL